VAIGPLILDGAVLAVNHDLRITIVALRPTHALINSGVLGLIPPDGVPASLDEPIADVRLWSSRPRVAGRSPTARARGRSRSTGCGGTSSKASWILLV
jgi:hypothetical protein